MGKAAASHIELYVRQMMTVMSVMRDNSWAPPPQVRDLLSESEPQQTPPPQPKLAAVKAEKAEQEVSLKLAMGQLVC